MWVLTTSVLWTSLGVLLFRFQFIPLELPQILGRSLYWIGVPLQILVLARRSNFTNTVWFPPLITVIVLLLGLGLASLSLYFLKLPVSNWLETQKHHTKLFSKILPKHRSSQGSFVLASMLGNTGFVGLAIAPAFVSKAYLGWVVLYGVTHNLLGSYGLGVLLASYFGRSVLSESNWWTPLRDLLSVPSLWAFMVGLLIRDVILPAPIEWGLQASLLFVVPGAFLLIGMQLSRLQGIQGLQVALIPAALKMLILPGLAGLGLTSLGLAGDGRFALVLMSGMPTAFANVILAEEYNLDRQLAASSILLSTVSLPLMIPLWLALFK